MSSASDGVGPFCGAFGCTADVVIHYPKHGRPTVCDEYTAGYEVFYRTAITD
ncbi:hypothetical protein [Salinilacihabitans rarus]|uniref:hypothetical protein n=1 Tax=Salinilacihabitans rarus TaxID=2961596 RepID=UPI0020C83AB0|nr:hypothetical protein [Salinilacihabitans rarus]